MSFERIPDEVVVVIGVGGMGEAAARRIGAGRRLLLADVSPTNLSQRAAGLRLDGHFVEEQVVDVADRDQMQALADRAGSLGRVRTVFHTAGLSPVDAPGDRIFRVNLLGVAHMLDVFEPLAGPGTVGIVVASMAGTMTPLPPDVLMGAALAPTDELLSQPLFDPGTDGSLAYGISKRANQVRVQAAALRWGARGGRVVSISPGIISTRDGRDELAGPSGDVMRQMLAASPAKRVGTAEDIATLVEFLASPGASFITGTDILIDGGVVAALFTGTPS